MKNPHNANSNDPHERTAAGAWDKAVAACQAEIKRLTLRLEANRTRAEKAESN